LQSGEGLAKNRKNKEETSAEANMSILIVDDEKDMGRLLGDILREEGFKVNNAFDGVTAISKVKQNHYDLMILDFNLSGMTGFNVLEKTKDLNPELKTIMISAYGDNKIKSKAKDYGVDDFLDKPFDINNLLETVKKATQTIKNNDD
jgi:DNA-binding response OmpR family regulator